MLLNFLNRRERNISLFMTQGENKGGNSHMCFPMWELTPQLYRHFSRNVIDVSFLKFCFFSKSETYWEHNASLWASLWPPHSLIINFKGNFYKCQGCIYFSYIVFIQISKKNISLETLHLKKWRAKENEHKVNTSSSLYCYSNKEKATQYTWNSWQQ